MSTFIRTHIRNLLVPRAPRSCGSARPLSSLSPSFSRLPFCILGSNIKKCAKNGEKGKLAPVCVTQVWNVSWESDALTWDGDGGSKNVDTVLGWPSIQKLPSCSLIDDNGELGNGGCGRSARNYQKFSKSIDVYKKPRCPTSYTTHVKIRCGS